MSGEKDRSFVVTLDDCAGVLDDGRVVRAVRAAQRDALVRVQFAFERTHGLTVEAAAYAVGQRHGLSAERVVAIAYRKQRRGAGGRHG